MGKRSRKRSVPVPELRRVEPAPPPVREPPRPLSRRARRDEAPKPPWAPFPLVELLILAGIVLIVVGFVGHGHHAVVMTLCGVALAGLGALDVSIREHFAGYRSHSALLALIGPAVIVPVLSVAFSVPAPALLGAAVAAFLAAFLALRAAFKRRTGGMAFRV